MAEANYSTLQEARAGMRWRVAPERFVLAGFSEPPRAEDLALVGEIGQVVREGEETTLLVDSRRRAQLEALHSDARLETNLVWIRFEGAMNWDLVGFLALVTGKLAAVGVPLGALCGFSRDHLFLAERHLASARAVLEELFGPEER